MKGKQKCEFLKRMRRQIAEINGLEPETRECTHEGDCPGTCTQCEREAQNLMAQLRELDGNAKLDCLELPVGDDSPETEDRPDYDVLEGDILPLMGNIIAEPEDENEDYHSLPGLIVNHRQFTSSVTPGDED